MSKISDEMRRVADAIDGFTDVKFDRCDGFGCVNYLDGGGIVNGAFTTKWFRNMADRIDAELVELPKDANDVPIRVGDTLYNSGKKYVVTCIFTDYCDHRFAFYANNNEFTAYNPESFTHECPDSLESIADELDDFADANYASGLLKQGIKDLAKRVRKLSKEHAE